MPPIDITGHRFGRLVAIKLDSNRKGHWYWLCHCDCGNEKIIQREHLTGGHTLSCRCLTIEFHRKRLLKHGEAKRTPEWSIWRDTRNRCNNPNNQAYKNYGGRGITICERWSNYSNFITDMGRRPTPKHMLERTNNNAASSPSNCAWATRSEQNKNRRSHGGRSKAKQMDG